MTPLLAHRAGPLGPAHRPRTVGPGSGFAPAARLPGYLPGTRVEAARERPDLLGRNISLDGLRHALVGVAGGSHDALVERDAVVGQADDLLGPDVGQHARTGRQDQ